MATITRIYTVTDIKGQKSLVRTYSPAAAISHIARNTMKATVSTQDELIDLIKSGVEVEIPGEDAAEQEQK